MAPIDEGEVAAVAVVAPCETTTGAEYFLASLSEPDARRLDYRNWPAYARHV